MFNTMKHAKKMQLIEYHEPRDSQRTINIYNRPVRDEDYPAPAVLKNLDGEMGSILNDTEIDDGQKWMLYQQALGRYLGFIKRMRHPQSVNNNETSDDPSYEDFTGDNRSATPPNALRGLQFLEQQQDQQQGAVPRQRQRQWKGTAATKKMMTRRNAEPWDLVSPLHTPKRKKNTERRLPYKAQYKNRASGNARSEVSNRRNNGFDIGRTAFNDDDDADMSLDAPSTHYPFHSSNITSTRTSPIQTRQGLPTTRPCSVRIDNSLTGWLQSNIKK